MKIIIVPVQNQNKDLFLALRYNLGGIIGWYSLSRPIFTSFDIWATVTGVRDMTPLKKILLRKLCLPTLCCEVEGRKRFVTGRKSIFIKTTQLLHITI